MRDHGQVSARRPTSRRAPAGARAEGARPPSAKRRPAAASKPAGRSRPATPARPAAPGRAGGSSRPLSATARATREDTDEARPPTITLRGLGLFVVLLVAFIVLAPTLRHAVEQQEQLRRLTADIEAAEQRTEALELELEQWQDPTFVKAQARDRLGYVMPGEQTFRVIDPETVLGDEVETEIEESGIPGMADAPWYLTVWESVSMAGEAVPGSDEDAED